LLKEKIMAITFTWSVKDMHKVTETGAVYRVDWSCSGVDADTKVGHSRSGQYMHTAAVEQTVSMTVKQETVTTTETVVKRAMPDPTAAGFKAYADLTEADVLAWCKADGEGARTEALITKSINSKIANNANSTGMPW
jgi:hypothetical protein